MAKHHFDTKNLPWFWHELALLLQQGKTISESLEQLCIDPITKKKDPFMLSIQETYQKNHSLADTLSTYDTYIDQNVVNLIRLGEQQDCHHKVFQHLAHHPIQLNFTKRIIKAISYPIIVLTLCCFIGIFLIIFITPIFAEMFSSMGQSLPSLTYFILNLSSWFLDYGWVMILSMLGVVFLLKMNQNFRFQVMLHIPFLKNILQWVAISELLEVFSMMKHHTSTQHTHLATAASTISNPIYRKTWEAQFKNSHHLLDALQKVTFLPLSFLRIISISAETGHLHETTHHLSVKASESANDALKRFLVWSQVGLILTVGGLVGSLVIAMYLPIFLMANGI